MFVHCTFSFSYGKEIRGHAQEKKKGGKENL